MRIDSDCDLARRYLAKALLQRWRHVEGVARKRSPATWTAARVSCW